MDLEKVDDGSTDAEDGDEIHPSVLLQDSWMTKKGIHSKILDCMHFVMFVIDTSFFKIYSDIII